MVEQNLRAADPRNYQLPGKVSLWFRLTGSIADADWKEFGNIIEPAIASQIETLQHFSQRRGARALDREVISSRAAQLNFTMDEINKDNLQFAFGSGTDSIVDTVMVNESKIKTNPGAAGVIELGDEDIELDSVVIRSIVRDVDEVTFADYTVDDVAGTITVTGGGDMIDTTLYPEVHIFYRKLVGTQSFKIFDGVEIEGEAKFQMLTPGGIKAVAVFNKVQVKNNGDITIGDGTDWQKVSMTVQVFVDEDGDLGTMHIVDKDELEEEE